MNIRNIRCIVCCRDCCKSGSRSLTLNWHNGSRDRRGLPYQTYIKSLLHEALERARVLVEKTGAVQARKAAAMETSRAPASASRGT